MWNHVLLSLPCWAKLVKLRKTYLIKWIDKYSYTCIQKPPYTILIFRNWEVAVVKQSLLGCFLVDDVRLINLQAVLHARGLTKLGILSSGSNTKINLSLDFRKKQLWKCCTSLAATRDDSQEGPFTCCSSTELIGAARGRGSPSSGDSPSSQAKRSRLWGHMHWYSRHWHTGLGMLWRPLLWPAHLEHCLWSYSTSVTWSRTLLLSTVKIYRKNSALGMGQHEQTGLKQGRERRN